MIWTCSNKLVSLRYITDLPPARRDTFGANGALDIGVLGHAERRDGYVYNCRLDTEVQIPKVRELDFSATSDSRSRSTVFDDVDSNSELIFIGVEIISHRQKLLEHRPILCRF